jgi:subtilisin-like proprotein convertase family protein
VADGTVHVIVESYFADPAPSDYEIHIGLYSDAAPTINEIAYDDDQTDDQEFVELYFGGGAFDLSGYGLVHINGSGGTLVWAADLAGRSIGDDGYFVIGPSELAEADAHWFADLRVDNAAEEDVIQNGGSSSEHVGDSLVLYWHYGLPDQTQVDAVEWEGDSAGPGEGPPAPGITYGSWNNSIGRFPDGADTDDNGADFVSSLWTTPGAPNAPAEPAGYVRLAYSAFGEEAAPRLPRAIPDDNAAGVVLTMDGTTPASGYSTMPATISDIQVGLNITHPDRGDLEVSLTSPAGTVVQLHDHAGGRLVDLETVWDLYSAPAESLAAFDTQDPRGATWRLNVADTVAGDTGTIREWVIWVR